MKTREEILKQIYMTPKDLKILIPEIGINQCREYIKEIRDEMVEQNMILPSKRNLLVKTKLVRKKFGI